MSHIRLTVIGFLFFRLRCLLSEAHSILVNGIALPWSHLLTANYQFHSSSICELRVHLIPWRVRLIWVIPSFLFHKFVHLSLFFDDIFTVHYPFSLYSFRSIAHESNLCPCHAPQNAVFCKFDKCHSFSRFLRCDM